MLCQWVSSSGHSNFCQYFGNSLPNEMESYLRRHEKFIATTSNLTCKKFTLKLETVHSSKVPHRKRQYTHWATTLLRRATYGILCPVHIKHVVGMLTWRIRYVSYRWACWCSTLLHLSYELKTFWYDFNRKEGTAEQGLFRYLLHERMTAFTHNVSVNYCAMWNVE